MPRSETWSITPVDQAGHRGAPKSLVINWTDPPPTSKMRVGTTWPGRSLYTWEALHYYIQSNGSVPSRPSGTPVWALTYTDYLRSQPESPANGVGWSNVASLVTKVRNHLKSLPDAAGMWANGYHEPEDNYGRTASGRAAFKADEQVFLNLVAEANQTRTNKLKTFTQYQGGSLTGSSPEDMTKWQPTSGCDAIGFDNYGYAQVQKSIDCAASFGLPLVVPEKGPLTNVPKVDTGAYPPGSISDYMQYSIPLYRAAGCLWVTWFNKIGSGGDLTLPADGGPNNYPTGLAYWKSQV